MNKDPIGERGGVNLYGFCRDNPVGITDYVGLFTEMHEFEAGFLTVQTSAVRIEGVDQPDRRIKIDFTLRPAMHCECSRVDFVQTFTIKNLEGAEPSLYQSETDLNPYDLSKTFGDGGVNVPWIRGTSGMCGRYVTDFSSYMMDTPRRTLEADYYLYAKQPDGTFVKRKTAFTFKSCAICLSGIAEGYLFGCVDWKLDYENLNPGTKPKISVLGFSTDYKTPDEGG